MKKSCIFAFVFLTFMVQWVGLSFAEKPKVVLKMSSNAPDEVGWSVYLRDPVGPALKRVTNGEVAFSWYWGGLMGDERTQLQKMSIDQLQGVAISGNIACPDMCVLSLPFLTNSYDELEYVEGKMRPQMDAMYQKYGNKLLMAFPGGYCPVYSTKGEMRTPDDFVNKKIRFWQWSTVVESDALKAFGGSAVPGALSEATPSIRAGLADVMMIPAMWWVGSQLYTVTEAITDTKMYYIPAALIITLDAWNRIPEQYHKPLEEELTLLEPGFWDFFIDGDVKCLQAMFKYGVKEVQLTPEELALWKKTTRPLWDRYKGSLFSEELFNEVMFHLKEFRSKTAAK